jgi:DNA-binding transcriptional ArsR family regulator
MQSGVPERALDPRAVASAESKMLPPRDERRMRQLLDALCDATRVKIVRALSDSNTLAAGDLAQVIGRSRSATSQHLKVLRDVGAVIRRRDGNVVRYTLAHDVSGQVIENAVGAFDGLRAASPAE